MLAFPFGKEARVWFALLYRASAPCKGIIPEKGRGVNPIKALGNKIFVTGSHTRPLRRKRAARGGERDVKKGKVFHSSKKGGGWPLMLKSAGPFDSGPENPGIR